MSKQMAFYFDASACTDCKTCQIACKDRSSLPVGVKWRRVFQYVGGSWDPVDHVGGIMSPNGLYSYSISISCMHCLNPACLDGCPVGAVAKRKEDGIVVIDSGNCIGCRYCEEACLYGAPQYNEETKTTSKCDFCVDLLEKGENPACVDACVMRCLNYGDLDELQAQYGRLNAVEPLPDADIAQPAFVIRPHRHARKSGQGDGKIENLAEEL